ncbi:tetratricopeptide repeat protein [Nonlabens ponticola]|uniref:Tetratricopeptide repeat protein n=1 Tax=Nonlabens ponticola TaxID=2496866 RepID=A0A3S9MUI3_9FLAO|nr:tetratricopeptide repeat protein [Nonlabens ponticola]AZQ42831.1 tetratricopeptide repeat protein [Nonlabens ponticola]
MPKILKQLTLTYFTCMILCHVAAQQSTIIAGDSLFALGRYSEALDQYNQVHDDVDTYKKIARVYTTMGNPDLAISSYEKALLITPEDDQTRFELGKLLLRSNQPLQALTIFKNLQANNSQVATYHYYLAESQDILNQTDSAIINYSQALKLQPAYRAARIESISNFIKTRQSFKAIATAQEGLQQNPDDIKINSLLGQAYYNAKLYDKAIEVFNKLFELGNDTEFNRKTLGLSYLGDAQWQQAADSFKIYIDQYEEGNALIWFQLARAYYRLKEYDKAVDAMENSILYKRPAIDQEYLQLSSIWAQKGDLKKAFNYIKLASQEAPEDEIIAYQLVLAADNYFKDKETIIQYYERFVQRFGTDSDYGESAAARLSDLKKEQFMSPQD